jgi:probable rRNA maturation factor
MKPAHPLQIFNCNPLILLPERKLKKITTAIYFHEKIPACNTTNLICCSDYAIRKLNRLYRHLDRATDVLSFNFDENDLLGEIYISLKRTAIQARRFGVSFNDEFVRLYVHGLLHLAGFDHAIDTERYLMETREQFYFRTSFNKNI